MTTRDSIVTIIHHAATDPDGRQRSRRTMPPDQARARVARLIAALVAAGYRQPYTRSGASYQIDTLIHPDTHHGIGLIQSHSMRSNQ